VAVTEIERLGRLNAAGHLDAAEYAILTLVGQNGCEWPEATRPLAGWPACVHEVDRQLSTLLGPLKGLLLGSLIEWA
jgi:hypothetical protein